MAEYKRKKVKKVFRHKKDRVNNDHNITMTNKHKKNIGVVPEDDIKIVRGTKFKRKQQAKILAIAVTFGCGFFR